MEMKEIVAILKEMEVDDYVVHKIKVTSSEIFVIKGQVDMPRIKQIREYLIDVFVDSEINGEKMRGHASTKIPSSYNEEELRQALKEAKQAASYIHDKYYDLPKRLISMNMIETMDSHIDRLEPLLNTLRSITCEDNERINSFEIFVKDIDNHLVTSSGSDITYHNKYNNIEVIVNVCDESHEIEVYYEDSFDLKSEEELREDINELFEMGEGRIKAIPNQYAPQNVIIRGKDVAKIAEFYTTKVDSRMIYNKASNAKINESIYKDEVLGDKITLKTFRHLAGASDNAPCGAWGTPTKDAYIIKDGVCQNYLGSYRYAYYLGIPCIPNIHYELSGGLKSESELKQEPYLECVEFSDFQVDIEVGDFAGELRLGYYFDGETRIPVSGGSISGNLNELGKEMFLAKELKKYDNNIVPKCILIKNVSIALGE